MRGPCSAIGGATRHCRCANGSLAQRIALARFVGIPCLNRSDPRPGADNARARRRLRCSRGPPSERASPLHPGLRRLAGQEADRRPADIAHEPCCRLPERAQAKRPGLPNVQARDRRAHSTPPFSLRPRSPPSRSHDNDQAVVKRADDPRADGSSDMAVVHMTTGTDTAHVDMRVPNGRVASRLGTIVMLARALAYLPCEVLEGSESDRTASYSWQRSCRIRGLLVGPLRACRCGSGCGSRNGSHWRAGLASGGLKLHGWRGCPSARFAITWRDGGRSWHRSRSLSATFSAPAGCWWRWTRTRTPGPGFSEVTGCLGAGEADTGGLRWLP